MANQSNWKPSHSSIAHDVSIEHKPSAVTNWDQELEHDDIKVHDVVMSEIPWFVWCVIELQYFTVGKYESYIKCFPITKK
jgi:hypothetical protein